MVVCLNNIRTKDSLDNARLDNHPNKIKFTDTCDYIDYEDIKKLKSLKGNLNIMQMNVRVIINE